MGMGYICPACGEGLPEDEQCPCTMEDAPDELFFVRSWPASLDEAMLCQGCGAAVLWRHHRDLTTGRFACPECNQVRPSHNASKQVRLKVADRDGWECHRCLMPIDQSLAWPHPLAMVVDHYPVSRLDGGPPIASNLKAAHSLCNGSNSVDDWRDGPRTDRFLFTAAERKLLDAIVQPVKSGEAPPNPDCAMN